MQKDHKTMETAIYGQLLQWTQGPDILAWFLFGFMKTQRQQVYSTENS